MNINKISINDQDALFFNLISAMIHRRAEVEVNFSRTHVIVREMEELLKTRTLELNEGTLASTASREEVTKWHR